MHRYATNFVASERLLFGLTLVAIAIAGVVGWLFSTLEAWWGVPLGSVSSAGVFALLFLCFDHILWRRPTIRRWLLIPDLNGKWTVRGRTVLKNGKPVDWPWEADLIVAQSWSRIRIVLQAKQSRSESIAAALYWQPGQGYRLIYHYDNTPQADQAELHRHSGTCDLLFDPEGTSAEGNYFTGSDRLTVGLMHLYRKETSK